MVPSLPSPSPLVGEGRGGGSGGCDTRVLHRTTPTPDPSPQGGGEACSQCRNRQENNNDLITTGTTPGGEINSPTSTKSSSESCTPSIETRPPGNPSSSARMRPMVLP